MQWWPWQLFNDGFQRCTTSLKYSRAAAGDRTAMQHMLTPTRACNTFPPLFWLFVVQGQYVTCGMPTRQELQALMGMHRREWAWIIDNHLPSDKLQVQRHPMLCPRASTWPLTLATLKPHHALCSQNAVKNVKLHTQAFRTQKEEVHNPNVSRKSGVCSSSSPLPGLAGAGQVEAA